jgi:hypothetical protein
MRFTDAARTEITGLLEQNPGKVLRVQMRGYG